MNLFRSVCQILLFVFLLTGCASKFVDSRVTIIGQLLDRDIMITNVSSIVNSNGFKEIQVTGINQTQFYKKLEYKIEWLDQNGMLIPTVLSNWTSFSAYQETEFRFKAVAPVTNAEDFRILIREGR